MMLKHRTLLSSMSISILIACFTSMLDPTMAMQTPNRSRTEFMSICHQPDWYRIHTPESAGTRSQRLTDTLGPPRLRDPVMPVLPMSVRDRHRCERPIKILSLASISGGIAYGGYHGKYLSNSSKSNLDQRNLSRSSNNRLLSQTPAPELAGVKKQPVLSIPIMEFTMKQKNVQVAPKKFHLSTWQVIAMSIGLYIFFIIIVAIWLRDILNYFGNSLDYLTTLL